jgi:hypothetical protein
MIHITCSYLTARLVDKKETIVLEADSYDLKIFLHKAASLRLLKTLCACLAELDCDDFGYTAETQAAVDQIKALRTRLNSLKW